MIVTVTLTTARAVRVGRLKATLVLGTARFTLGAGQRKAVTLRLASGHRSLASRAGRISATARTLSRDAAGNRAEASRRVSLRLAARR